MYCRLENIDETSEGFLCNLEACILQYSEVLFVSGNAKDSLFFKKTLAKFREYRY